MERAETEEAIAIMQAWVDGKTIQYKPKRIDSVWSDVIGTPEWSWYNNHYRVKPQVKYRPYNSPEECFDNLRCDGWLKRREGKVYKRIYRLDMYVDYQKLFKEYTYVDGTPFGLKVN